MAGGIHPAEWLFPAVGLTHLGVNAAVQQVDASAKPATPGSKLSRERNAAEDRERLAGEAQQRLSEATALAEQNRVDAIPDNVRRRAASTSARLGESGRRPSASAFLSGSY